MQKKVLQFDDKYDSLQKCPPYLLKVPGPMSLNQLARDDAYHDLLDIELDAE